MAQMGKVDVRTEEPIMRRRDRMPTITVRGDLAVGLQPPDVSSSITQQLEPIMDKPPRGAADLLFFPIRLCRKDPLCRNL